MLAELLTFSSILLSASGQLCQQVSAVLGCLWLSTLEASCYIFTTIFLPKRTVSVFLQQVGKSYLWEHVWSPRFGHIPWPKIHTQRCEHIKPGWELRPTSCWWEETQAGQILLPHAPGCPRDCVLRDSCGRALALPWEERQASDLRASSEGLAIEHMVRRHWIMTDRDKNIQRVKTMIHSNSPFEVLYLLAASLNIYELKGSRIYLLTAFCPSSFWTNWWAAYFLSLKTISRVHFRWLLWSFQV